MHALYALDYAEANRGALVIAVLIAIIAVCAAVIIYLRIHGIVYVGRTAAGTTVVHDDTYVMGERIRVLEVAGTYQSATYLDDRWADLVFPYHKAFEHLFDAWVHDSEPRELVILGGGGYAIPKHLVAHHPEVTRIDVVEIDPAIERIARAHFFVNRLEERFGAESSGLLNLHVADAYDWLEENTHCYDAIINDCFFGLAPEESLITHEAAVLIQRHLTPRGLYLTNVVSALKGPDSAILRTTVASLDTAFQFIWIYPGSPQDPESRDNNVVIASNAHHDLVGAQELVARRETT